MDLSARITYDRRLRMAPRRLALIVTAALSLGIPLSAPAEPCTPVARPVIASPLESIPSIPRIECIPDSGSGGVLLFNEIANTSVSERDFVMDAEELQTTLAAAIPAGDGYVASLAVPFRTRGQGFLDDLIIGWHDAFGLPDGDTDKFDRNSYEVEGENGDGSNFSVGDHSFTLADATAAFSGDSILGEPIVWTVSGSFPTSISGAAHRGVNASLDVRRIFRSGRWAFDAAGGVTVLGDREFDNVRYDPAVWRTQARAGYDLLDRLTVEARLQLERTAVSGIDGYPGHAIWAEFRALIELTGAGTVVLSLREDINGHEAQPDVVLGLGLMTAAPW